MKIVYSIKNKLGFCIACVAAMVLLSANSYAANDISADQYAAMDKEGLVLVDVRTPEEYADGHIPNAINLPVAELPELLDALPNKDQKLVVYCRSGFRAGKAIDYLKSQGYTSLQHLDGDYSGWAEENRPIAKP